MLLNEPAQVGAVNGGEKLINYECLREPLLYDRDMYSELKRIEERGKRLRKERTWTRIFRGIGKPARA